MRQAPVPRLTDCISVMKWTIFTHELKENSVNPPSGITHLTGWPRSIMASMICDGNYNETNTNTYPTLKCVSTIDLVHIYLAYSRQQQFN